MSAKLTAPLREIVALLEDAAIPFMVVGAFASMVHGHPRTTFNLDIVIDSTPEALDHLLAGSTWIGSMSIQTTHVTR